MPIDKDLEDIFNDPLFNNIGDEDLSLFNVPENLKPIQKEKADYIASRKQCQNFHDYEPLFKDVHRDLQHGKRSLLKFNSQALQEGHFYISGGILMYLEKITDLRKGQNGLLNGRTRIIYDNGSESDILLDTLRRSIYLDGYIVTDSIDTDEQELHQKFGISDNDIHDGWIYILRSLSENPKIKGQTNLYKIGFSTTPVEVRIANANNDPTYLMDKVEIVTTWKTYNINTHKLEGLIHLFFNSVQFKIQLVGDNGSVYNAREWYKVPLGIIEMVINRIIDGSILHYRYNPSLESLEELPHKENDEVELKILTLIINQDNFDKILTGGKKIQKKELKQSHLNKFTWIGDDGKRYLKKFDAIRFFVGTQNPRPMLLIQVLDTKFDGKQKVVEYYLGNILEN